MPVARGAALDPAALAALAGRIEAWAYELGFDATGIGDTDLTAAESGLLAWLDAGFHGAMDYMAKHGLKRARPGALVPGTVRVISVRMAYLPASSLLAEEGSATDSGDPVAHAPDPARSWRATEFARLADPGAAVVSVYARGRDYHKVMRARLQKLVDRIADAIGPFGHRVFTDSAPVLEVELAQKAALGARGKHTLLLQRDSGSLFFLGEIYIDLPLPVTRPARADGALCGTCTRCIAACPTGAIVGPYRLDARRCISYLTIELPGSIPVALRPLMGNHIYGCDDCQLVCPWNKFARTARVDDFEVRNGLDGAGLVELFDWTEDEFNARLEGSPIRRIGHERWLRNIAVALGNALRASPDGVSRDRMSAALRRRATHPSALVREHVQWALSALGHNALIEE